MLRRISFVSLLFVIGVFTIFSQYSCFLMGRSDIDNSNTFLTIPEALNSIENVAQKRIPNDTVHVAKFAKLGTRSDDKMIIYNQGKKILRKKRSETSVKTSEELFAIKPNSSMALSHLRNVVLTLVDTTRQIRDEFWINFEKIHSFPVHGYFQIDDNREESGPIKIELNEFMGISGRNEDQCECRQTLRSRISELLIWARRVKEMTTSVLSAIRFSIPFLSDIEGVADIEKENELNKNISKERVYKSELLQNDSSSSLDSQEANYTDFEENYEQNVSSNGNVWDVFDLFTKIKIAFFRAMINCLKGPTDKMDDEFSAKESSYLRTSYINLVDGTMKNLKIVSGDKGYMLVLVIPENELTSVMDLLRYQISPSDTLVIVTELCSRDIKHVSFFADGPEASTLYRIRTIKELPDIVKSLLSRSCQKQDCPNPNQHFDDVPIRIARDTNLNSSIKIKLENMSKGVLNDTLAEKIDVSSTSDIALNKVNMFIGIVISLIALMTLNSS